MARPEDIYLLYVYPPGDEKTPWMFTSSERPFLSIHPGDLIERTEKWVGRRLPGTVLRVVNVQHLFTDIDSTSPKHHLRVYTEEVGGDRTRKIESS